MQWIALAALALLTQKAQGILETGGVYGFEATEPLVHNNDVSVHKQQLAKLTIAFEHQHRSSAAFAHQGCNAEKDRVI
jgi:hypothetical protein